MGNSIDIFHNERKILSSFDNLFYRKDMGKWYEVRDSHIFKGTKNPSQLAIYDDAYLNSKKGDYYIQYDEIGNYIKYSEDFVNNGWNNINVKISSFDKKFPNSYCSKIIPTNTFGEHFIAYEFDNDSDRSYWCFSIYVIPNEFNYFELSISDSSEQNGIRGTFSISLDATKKLIIRSDLKAFGDTSMLIYDDDCIGIEKISEKDFSYYRAYISLKYNRSSVLKSKFSILKNYRGQLLREFSNENEYAGLFINAAQLSKSKKPIEYIKSDGYYNYYLKFNSLHQKENNWRLLDFAKVYYNDKKPSSSLGQTNDICMIDPILTLSNYNRLGNNPMLAAWIYSNGTSTNIYYTVSPKPEMDDLVFEYDKKRGEMVIKFLVDHYDEDYDKLYFRNIGQTPIIETIECELDYDYEESHPGSYISKWNGTNGPYYTRYHDYYRNPLKNGDGVYAKENGTYKIGVVCEPERQEDTSDFEVNLTKWSFYRGGSSEPNTIYITSFKTTYEDQNGDIVLPNIPARDILYFMKFNKKYYVTYTASRIDKYDRRNIHMDNIIFWNEEKDTYSYLSNKLGYIRDYETKDVIGYVGKKILLHIDDDGKVVISDDTIPLKEVNEALRLNYNDTTEEFIYTDEVIGYVNENGIVLDDNGNLIGNADINMYNIKFESKSMYDFKQINNAIAFSTNLFNQTYSTRYASNPQELRFGYNTGGHGNFWDYNSLRRYY